MAAPDEQAAPPGYPWPGTGHTVPNWQLVEHRPTDVIMVAMLADHLEPFAAWLDSQGLTLGRFPDWDDEDEGVHCYVVVPHPDRKRTHGRT